MCFRYVAKRLVDFLHPSKLQEATAYIVFLPHPALTLHHIAKRIETYEKYSYGEILNKYCFP